MARPVRATDSMRHGVAYRSRGSRGQLAALYFAPALPAPPPGSVERRIGASHPVPASVRPEVLEAFRQQATGCRESGSEFTARLMERCVADLEAGGPVAELVAGFRGHPFLDALCQRVLGAVQLLVLSGDAPDLARFYPAVGGTPAWPDAGDAFVETVACNLERLRPRLAHQVQTNEVRRCAGLLGGFLEVARSTGLPLRCREMGSSAGLVLFWDRYRYELGPHRWGDPAAPVVIATDWRGPPPDLDALVRVASRLGCDLAPIDATDPDALRVVQSFYWADQPGCRARSRSASPGRRRRRAPGPRRAAPWPGCAASRPRPPTWRSACAAGPAARTGSWAAPTTTRAGWSGSRERVP